MLSSKFSILYLTVWELCYKKSWTFFFLFCWDHHNLLLISVCVDEETKEIFKLNCPLIRCGEAIIQAASSTFKWASRFQVLDLCNVYLSMQNPRLNEQINRFWKFKTRNKKWWFIKWKKPDRIDWLTDQVMGYSWKTHLASDSLSKPQLTWLEIVQV